MPITVIIPVYKDWTSLSKCIQSLIAYAPADSSIIIINDNSDEADELEVKIKEAIAGQSRFNYYRNAKNLGFIKTCNRGAFELDQTDNDILLLNSDTEITEGALQEMQAVLALSEKHGVVCPRSNNATLLSIPVYYEGDKDDIIEESYLLHKKIQHKYPQYSILPAAVGFCMLIRRHLIVNFGLFDEKYGKGYNEENDFCMRINQIGYNVLAANHAFVFHFESKSFGSEERIKRDSVNRKILDESYPHFTGIVNHYFKYDINPLDHFSEALLEKNSNKILVSLLHIPPCYNGTSIYGLNITQEIIRLYAHQYDIHILVSQESDRFFGLSEKYDNVFYPEQAGHKTFPICFMPCQVFDLHLLSFLNTIALRFIFTLQDIISIRCQYLLQSENKKATSIFSLSYKYADGIIAISDFVKKDAERFFSDPTYYGNDHGKVSVVYHGTFRREAQSSKVGDYILVVGNRYYHKVLAETLAVLANDKANKYIVLGSVKNRINAPNITFLASGKLSNEEVEAYYKNARCIIFPSHYEGFGLPIFDSILFSKPVIVYKNELNQELASNLFHNAPHIRFYEYFRDIPSIISSIDNDESTPYQYPLRTWEDTARDTMEVILKHKNKEIDYSLLVHRFKTINMISEFLEESHLNRFADSAYMWPESNLKRSIKKVMPSLVWDSMKRVYKKINR